MTMVVGSHTIDLFTVAGLVAWPLSESEAGGDLVPTFLMLMILISF